MVYKKVDPRHYSQRNIMRKGDEVQGDMHWIKEAPKNKNQQTISRTLWCGITEDLRGVGMSRTKVKSTFNRMHVTCPDCIAEGEKVS